MASISHPNYYICPEKNLQKRPSNEEIGEGSSKRRHFLNDRTSNAVISSANRSVASQDSQISVDEDDLLHLHDANQAMQ